VSKVVETLDEDLVAFIARQRIFFVATAPNGSGHINVSPKGADSFRLLGPRHAAYIDMTGSGIETLAHLKENGRIVIMFCAFEGSPRILRLQGTGMPHERGTPGYERLKGTFPALPGARAIMEIRIARLSTSCGYAVPFFDYKGEREQLTRWAEAKGEAGLADYRSERNARSIDGLQGFVQRGAS
jgi:Pyridoxamine 5'-phosphate oxidase